MRLSDKWFWLAVTLVLAVAYTMGIVLRLPIPYEVVVGTLTVLSVFWTMREWDDK